MWRTRMFVSDSKILHRECCPRWNGESRHDTATALSEEALRNQADRVGDDAKVIFGEAGARNVQDWAHDMIDERRLEKSMRSQS